MVMITLQITEEDLRVLYNAAGDGLSAMFEDETPDYNPEDSEHYNRV